MKKLTLSDNDEWSDISDAISSLATALNSIHSSATCSAQYSDKYVERANWYLKLAFSQLRRAGFSASDFDAEI